MEWLSKLKQFESTLNGDGYILQVFIVILLTAVANLILSVVYHRLLPRFEKSASFWNDAVLRAAYKPLGVLIWVVGLSVAADITSHYAEEAAIFQVFPAARKLGVVMIMAWFLIRLIDTMSEAIVNRPREKPVDKTTAVAVTQLLRVSVLITTSLVALDTMNVKITGILAFGGIGGIGVTLAAKDLLANFFGGLMIYLDRPFAVGDWVRSPDRDIEGTVEHIGWRLTRIRTFDKRPLYVPNGVFSNISVENPSRMSNRRIKTTIGVRYQDAPKIEVMLKDIEAMLRSHDEIDQKQTTFVHLVNFAPSSLDFLIYTFTKTTNWVKFQAVQQDVFLNVIKIIESHGAECAFPTTTLDLPEKLPNLSAV